MVSLKDIQRLYPGKIISIQGDRIVIKDSKSSGRTGTGKSKFSYLVDELVPRMESDAIERGEIYIPYEVMSSKNSKQFSYIYSKQQQKKVPRLISSPQYQKYAISTAAYWKKNRVRFREMIQEMDPPYKIGFFFIRCSKQRFDYPNLMQGAMDLMVKYEWLTDDDSTNIMPIPVGFRVEREVQGLIISIDGKKTKDL